MKQNKNARRVAGTVGEALLGSVQGGGTPLPADRIRLIGRGPLEGTPLPAGPLP